MYNFNEELCRQLSNCEIACKYDNGNLEMLRALLKKCAPKDCIPIGCAYFYLCINGFWGATETTTKPTVPLSDFIVKESENIDYCNNWSEKTKVEFANYCINDVTVGTTLDNTFKQFKASKQRKPLRVSEDGKTIYEGDKYWYVETDNDFHIVETIANSDESEYAECKDFSTEAAALEFVRLNKPLYSLNDVKQAWRNFTGIDDNQKLITELEKLKQ